MFSASWRIYSQRISTAKEKIAQTCLQCLHVFPSLEITRFLERCYRSCHNMRIIEWYSHSRREAWKKFFFLSRNTRLKESNAHSRLKSWNRLLVEHWCVHFSVDLLFLMSGHLIKRYSLWLSHSECDIPVLGIPGTENFSFLGGIGKNWYWKKSGYRYWKYLVLEKVSEPASEKFGIGIVQNFGYRDTLIPLTKRTNLIHNFFRTARLLNRGKIT